MYCDLWSQYINVRKLFKGGNYLRAETIWGNTVLWFHICNSILSIFFMTDCWKSYQTYNEWPKMKRDIWQKTVIFLRKRLLSCWVSIFIFGCLSYVMALPYSTIFYESVLRISIIIIRWFVRYKSSKWSWWFMRSKKCPWGIHGVCGVPRGNDFEIIT